MHELVYKLLLPEFNEIKLDSYTVPVQFPDDYGYITHRTRNIIKPEFVTINGVYFNDTLMFFKGNGRKGLIHRDKSSMWGINWVSGGHCLMEYWDDYTNFREFIKTDISGNVVIMVETNDPPTRVYVLSEGAWLINATVAHRASGTKNRCVHSLRTTALLGNGMWEDIIAHYSNLIE